MDEMENKILAFLESGYKIDIILNELNVAEENLADAIIELDKNGLIALDGKNWVLTQKGKNILKEIKELLKGLKLEYMYGNISRDEFWKKRKELESAIVIGKPKEEGDKEKNMNCSQCGKENRPGSIYCYKCGKPLIN